MTDGRRTLLALASSLLIHAIVLVGPSIRLPFGEDEPPVGIRIEARLQAPPQPVVKKAPAKPRPRPVAKPQSMPGVAQAQLAQGGKEVAVPVPEEKPTEKSPPESEVAKAPEPVVPDKKAEPAPPATKALSAAPFSDMLASASQGSVSYRVSLGRQGLIVGRMTHRWKRDRDRYELEGVTETVGLVSLFRSIRLTQTSRGRMDGTGLRPDEFTSVQDEGGGDITKLAARFDWSAGRLRFERDGAGQEVGLEAASQDILSFIYQLVLHPPEGRTDMRIATGKAYNAYVLEYRGDETVPSPVGDVKARHYLTVAPPGEQSTEIWLAEELGFLPVKVRFVDRKGTVTDAQVQSVDFGAVVRRPEENSPIGR